MVLLADMGGDWWTVQQAAWVGAGIGVLGGVFGTVLGSCAFLVARGKAKRLMLGGWALMAAIGALALIAGCGALLMKQPYHVFYPLLLTGFLFTLLGVLLGSAVWRQYKLVEARKVDAAQIRGG